MKFCPVCLSAIVAARYGKTEEDVINIKEPEKEMLKLRVEE